jgi:hypothetical protein
MRQCDDILQPDGMTFYSRTDCYRKANGLPPENRTKYHRKTVPNVIGKPYQMLPESQCSAYRKANGLSPESQWIAAGEPMDCHWRANGLLPEKPYQMLSENRTKCYWKTIPNVIGKPYQMLLENRTKCYRKASIFTVNN